MTGFTFIPKHIHFILLVASILVFFSNNVDAENLHQKAQQLAKSGDIPGMEETYLKILKINPHDIQAQLGYATARSWQGYHEDAQQTFKNVLRQLPDNLEALIGLGYDYVWSNQFDQADFQFNRALDIAPDNVGANKGLAFSALWNKQPQKALDIFQQLQRQRPNDAEILAALGQAQLALNKDEEAERSFQLALLITPDRPDALDGLARINEKKKNFDFIVWAGNTSNGGDSGLREVIIGYRLKEDLRIWARYDNSLSLDNPALVRSSEDSETFFFGVLKHIHKNWNANLEIGTRDLPNNADQQIYKLEAFDLNQQKVFKLGVQLSPHSDGYTEKLVYSAYGFPVNEKWRLEPSLYLSSSGAIDDREWRAVLLGEYLNSDHWSLGLSVGVGRISSDIASAEGSVFTSNILFSYPISQRYRVNLSLRYEDAPTINFTTALIGIEIQLP